MPKKTVDPDRGELLVAIMNAPSDFEILKTQGWYRVPVDTAPKRWPPQWIAFYQTKVFGDEAHAVRHYGQMAKINRAPRHVLFPDEPENPTSPAGSIDARRLAARCLGHQRTGKTVAA